MFEGLGLGSRLAYLPLPDRLNWVPFGGALLYAIMTPIGVAAGLGVRTTYDANSETAQIVSGVLDALSAGILLYTGLVELLAHEFLYVGIFRRQYWIVSQFFFSSTGSILISKRPHWAKRYLLYFVSSSVPVRFPALSPQRLVFYFFEPDIDDFTGLMALLGRWA
jgi:hypothetical protein